MVHPASVADVEITARGPASDLDDWTIAAPTKGSIQSITAQDLDGMIAVSATEEAPKAGARDREGGSGPALRLHLARPPVGPLRMTYSAAAKPNTTSTAPTVELDPDRFRALGRSLFALPDAAEEGYIALSLAIDTSDVDKDDAVGALRVASSFGVGSPREARARASEIREALLLAGHMGTAVFNTAEGRDEAAWIGYTTFDPRPIAADVASFRTAVGQIFREPLPMLATLLITADGRAPGAFVAARRAGGVAVNVNIGEPWTGAVRIAVATEVIKAWIGERLWIGPADAGHEAEAAWFTEGLTRHLARDLLFRFGLITQAELLDEVNGLEALLATSPLKGESNTALAARAGEAGALPLLVARGAIYATRVDALLRKKSSGKASLETVLSALYGEARTKRGPLPTTAWTDALANALDKAEATAFGTIIGDGKAAPTPSDALGPCFKGGPAKYEPFDLGFDLEATRKLAGDGEEEEGKITGVRAGGPAAKAGLRDGDTLIDSKISKGRADVPVAITIKRGGTEKKITYRPAGPSVSGEGWTRVKGVSDDACAR